MGSAMKLASGSVLKKVQCETCGFSYEYTLERTALGKYSGSADKATAAKLAEEDAAAHLKKDLETGCDIKPCPECGAITREMEKFRRAFLPQMMAAGGTGLGLIALVLTVGKMTGRYYLFAAGAGAVLFLWALLIVILRSKEMFMAGKERKGIRSRVSA